MAHRASANDTLPAPGFFNSFWSQSPTGPACSQGRPILPLAFGSSDKRIAPWQHHAQGKCAHPHLSQNCLASERCISLLPPPKISIAEPNRHHDLRWLRIRGRVLRNPGAMGLWPWACRRQLHVDATASRAGLASRDVCHKERSCLRRQIKGHTAVDTTDQRAVNAPLGCGARGQVEFGKLHRRLEIRRVQSMAQHGRSGRDGG